MLVAACIAATILLGAHAALSSEAQRPHRTALALAFAAAALGVLAKGLIGVVLPIIVLLGWGLATSRTRRIGRLLLWPHGWLVFFAIAAPWFIAMQQRFPGFAHYFFVVQHLQRFASVGFNNPQPRWFYPVVLLATTLPWSPWLLALLTQGGARTWLRGGRGDLRALMLVWLVVITAFFSVPDSKLIGYILPALPPLAFLIGDALGSRGAPQRLRLATGVVAATLCVAIVAVEHFYQPKSLAALAARLQADRAAAEPVVFLGNYYYDLPFYARLDAPVLVADRWAPAEVAKDSWRRELVDAEGFAPASARHLVGFDELAPALCGATSAWIVGPWPSSADTPWLSTQQPLYREGQVALWRVRPSSLVAGKCAGLR
jgi:4-amino-4-deoxy-L-arabinose transferase-like glycosyltransferase